MEEGGRLGVPTLCRVEPFNGLGVEELRFAMEARGRSARGVLIPSDLLRATFSGLVDPRGVSFVGDDISLFRVSSSVVTPVYFAVRKPGVCCEL